MSKPDSERFLDDPHFQSLLIDCLEKLERGEALDREAISRRHPEHAEALAELIDDQESFRRIVGGLRDSLRGQSREQHPDETLDYPRKPDEFAAGERIRYLGEYEILEEIARGGMGIVFKARQQRLNRIVALKMILAGQLAGEEDVRRFRAEAEAAAQLDHPNIVPIFEVGEHQGQHYFSMGYVDGPSLDQRVARGPLPPTESATLVETLAEAIAYAHSKGVIHRDLKPATVLLQEKDGGVVPRITDFGLAKRLEVNEQLTVTGQIVGTPSYMPPEQAAGSIVEVTETADVYSLGAILYCLLVGHPPFQAATILETLQQVLTEEPAPPRRINPAIPLDLETICLKCLAKGRRQRYESAQALADDLARFRRGEPILARRVGTLERGMKWARRHPAQAAVWVLLPIALLLGTVGVGAAWLWHRAETARANLAVEKSHTEEALDREQLAKEKAETALIVAQTARKEALVARDREADARSELATQKDYVDHLLYARRVSLALAEIRDNEIARAREMLLECAPERRHWEWRHVWRQCHPSLMTWASGDGHFVSDIALNPGTRDIAIAEGKRNANEGAIKIWNPSSGETRTLVPLSYSVTDLSYSPDGQRLAAACSDGHLRVWDVTNGRELVTVAVEKFGRYVAICFSPDSKRIAAINWVGVLTRQLGVWDAVTGARVFVRELPFNTIWCLAFDPQSGRLLTGGSKEKINVWDVDKGEELFSLTLPGKGDDANARTLSVSPDGKHIAVGTLSGRIVVWENAEGTEPRRLGAHDGNVHRVQFSPDGAHLASGGADHKVKVWEVASGKEVLTLKGHTGAVKEVFFATRGRRLVSQATDKTVRVWSATGPVDVPVLKGHGYWVRGVAFTPDSRHLVSCSWDRTVRVWDAETGELLSVIDDKMVDTLSCVAISPDGKHVAAGTGNTEDPARPGVIAIWDLNTKNRVLSLKGHQGSITDISYSPDGRRLVSSSPDKTARMWDAITGKELFTVTPKSGWWVTGVSFSPDGKQFATASASRIHVWDATDGTMIREFQSQASIGCVAFSPDGSRVAGSEWHYKERKADVAIWDLQTGEQVLSFHASIGEMEAICFSPDGNRLATAGYDQTIKLWDSKRGTQLLSLKGHESAIVSICFSPDGKRLASSSLDKTIRIWNTLDE